jgi:hypothetical protein
MELVVWPHNTVHTSSDLCATTFNVYAHHKMQFQFHTHGAKTFHRDACACDAMQTQMRHMDTHRPSSPTGCCARPAHKLDVHSNKTPTF